MNMIRQATLEDAPAIARVHVESWQSTYRGIIPDTYLDNLSTAPRERMWTRILSATADTSIVLVAVDKAGEIVGFINGGRERDNDPVYNAELYAIYLLDSCHGHGTGRALTQALAAHLVQAGYSTMLVWVLADNPTVGFYQHLGAHYLRSKRDEIGGADLEEAAYGWSDIRALL
ncbi:N-acetyltransferase [Dictyobacter vulcani]|uniref:N-acetyltransferase n=1 Tax=Dictyobacter vulcani TaxID=2607529 RepID=A0A5J4KI65_9CHLR|nr:GNAT family N-acetyltransferase [Dictyobacter vulcani]GER89184.1 N-acetyltransferase [Dictyobacter vulcani]